jgi:hypothetical protein
MPGLDPMKQHPSPQMLSMLQRLAPPTNPSDELALQVAALREEIAELRAELSPVPSLILTGREVVEQFKKLNLA